MDQIQHNYIQVRGLNFHLAEIGSGRKVVIFIHGFPEIWYSWRHQMVALANAGYRAIAYDCRGYGFSDKPSNPETTSFNDFIQDLLGIIDHLAIPKAFLVAKDAGVMTAYSFALLYPDRVQGLITMGVPYHPDGARTFCRDLPPGFYIYRWQEPERAEADFGRFDAKTVVRKIYTMFSGTEIPIAKENQEIMDLVTPETPLPAWFSEEDLKIYGELYENSGFQTALQVPYRSVNEEFNIADRTLKQSALFIMGRKDYVFKFTGVQEFLESGKAKESAPNMDIVFLPQGTHFVQEQLPDIVNNLVLDFLRNHA